MKMRVRGKILLSLAMLLPILLALAPPVNALPTVIKVIFRDTGTSEMVDVKTPGQQFTIDIMIENSPPIVQWMLRIQWNEDVLSFVPPVPPAKNPAEGTFLSNVGGTTFLVKPALPGKLPEMTCILTDPVEASGNGDLCAITFVVDSVGETNIEIYDSALLNALQEPQLHTVVNGHFLIHPPPPTPPTASFIPQHCTQFTLDETGQVTVDFNAASSLPGWDVLPSGHTCPIVEYRWNLTYTTPTILATPSPVVAADAGETHDVEITIMDAPAIVGWMVKVQFDPTVLECVDVEEGDFLSGHGYTGFMSKPEDKKYKPGILPGIACVLMEDFTVNGDGLLAILHFQSKKAGSSNIVILASDLMGVMGQSLPFNGWDAISFEPTLNWTFTEIGDVEVTLEVYAPDPTPPTDERYVATDTVKHTIHIMPYVTGPEIDVYTQRGGQGSGYDPFGEPFPWPSGWSDAFGPQEEVIMYAYVTYNKEPVEYKPVAFEIQDPFDGSRDYRTAFTNAQGIAVTSFRIPWTGSAAESLFGDWSIFGTVSLSEVTVEDICKFKFGYIVDIDEDGINVAGSPLKKGQSLTLSVNLVNIAKVSKDAYVTIVACDECDVPIGLAGDFLTIPSGSSTSVEWTITIPTWAFVGSGALYANVYTLQPSSGGVPMCPEEPATFIINRT